LLKRARPDFRIELIEQNASDATFGFGLAFSERALEFLKQQDAETWAALQPSFEFWSDSILYLNGAVIRIDGMVMPESAAWPARDPSGARERGWNSSRFIDAVSSLLINSERPT